MFPWHDRARKSVDHGNGLCQSVIAPFFTNPTTLARICRRHHAGWPSISPKLTERPIRSSLESIFSVIATLLTPTALTSSLKIPNRLESVNNINRRVHESQYIIRRLIRFGRLIERRLACARTVDAGIAHLVNERPGIERLERFGAAHRTTRPMRRRAVPVLVSLAARNNGTVAHVERNQHHLARMSANSALANHAAFRDVVVHGGKAVSVESNSRTLNNLRDNRLAVLIRKALAVMHIDEILGRKISHEILKLVGNICRARLLRQR